MSSGSAPTTWRRERSTGILLGAIADDFTGATDLASNLVQRGFRTVVATAAAAVALAAADTDAVVVALKTRTAPVAEAVDGSLKALAALQAAGAEQFYFKYCSTFDSTPEGNIGPVMDALMAELSTDSTVVVPSFPANGRTVYQQHLFVHGVLLSESSMRHHPLTPMTESNVVTLLRPQTTAAVHGVSLTRVRAGVASLRETLRQSRGSDPQRQAYVIDAIDDDDLRIIAEAASGLPLVTGGSGLALGMTGPGIGPAYAPLVPAAAGRRLVLSGSASSTTRSQVGRAQDLGRAIRIDVAALEFRREAELDRVTALMEDQWAVDPQAAPVVYATGPEDAETNFTAEQAGHAERIESAFGELARRALTKGVRHLVVAGGETSGSVTTALGVQTLEFGVELDPGVAWVTANTAEDVRLNLVLKSGNFGRPDLFESAWEVLP